ncbi:MAG TPA: folylpolyglutamate synthase/dihydrofolate synthase family protein [Terriglobales bacterium]|nr:folylpolyglutamate synthase/dihydrofolate synthase family protein [Terriglobales bacterium]
MTYAAAVAALYSLGHELASPKQKFDLRNMEILAEAMGHPERRFPSVLIAGTNGKGSTSATLAAILEAAGYRTGLYTSPHLVKINERIQIDGEPISDPEFTEIYSRVIATGEQLVLAGKLAQQPSFFEMMTAMAFEYFASARVDIVVLEVGMGGRLDATNIVTPVVSVITDVSLDHQNYLGNTVGEIAREKAGIIKENGVLVTLPQHPQANDVIGQVATERNARGVSATRYVPNVSPGAVKFDALRPIAHQTGAFFRSRYFLEVMSEAILIETPLIGRHQLRNVALAIATAEELNQHGFSITPQQVATGVAQTRWPGRFQFIARTHAHPDCILDVAHNPAGAWALRSAVSENFDGRPITLVFGAMRDKAIPEMLQILAPIVNELVLTHADTPRAANELDIKQMEPRLTADAYITQNVADALTQATRITPENGLVVITGSIYVVGAALAAWADPA